MHKPVWTAFAGVLVLCLLLFTFKRERQPAVSSQAGATPAVTEERQSSAISQIPTGQSTKANDAAASPAAPSQAAAAVLDPIGAFKSWTSNYMAAAEADRPALVADGVALAQARRPMLKNLIKEDPRRALEEAVPMVVRQQLPPEVVDWLETRVNGRAALRVYQGVGLDNQSPAPTHRVAEFASGETYVANVYGRRAESVRWLDNASLNGVAVDEQFATHEDPIRRLEVGERPDETKTAKSICPVSGETSLVEEEKGEPITEETPAIEAYGEVIYLCNGSHAIVYNEQLIYAEGSTGGAMTFTGILPAAPTPSIGNVKVLVIPMTFADQNDTPTTETALYQLMREVGEHYSRASYGKLTLAATVTPTIKLPHNEAWYVQKDTDNGGPIDGLGLEHSHARAEARKLGYDDADFHTVVVRLRGGAKSIGIGGWGGGNSVWIYSDGLGLTAHEIGHCFGLAHANLWQTSGTSAIGVGSNDEYKGHWDVMGDASLPNGHYNVAGKNQIRWLPDPFVTEVTSSGIYTIYAQDQSVLDPSKRFALKLRKDSLRTYWGELRGLWTGDSTRTWADHGLILGWRYPSGGGGNWQLIDTTPGSPFGRDDSPVSLGRTFSDYEAGIHLTTLGTTPASNDVPKSITVVVNLGQFESNRPPTLALSAPATVVPVNVPVPFTASATDPDGDPLAYSWQHFGNSSYRTISPNSPVLTRSFSAAGTYIVTCTVSDMKGGTATRNLLVTVGNGGGRYTISGRITMNGQGLAGVLVNANSSNGVITDSDGQYTIPNLSAATYAITPLLYGYTFSELFNNSITVAPNFAGADFEAAASPRVTIAATAPTCIEGNTAAPARFTITRTGDASQALTVNVVSPIGSASSGSDYSLSPSLGSGSQGFSSVTIPANAESLVLSVTPSNDTAVEGTETVILQLGPGNGYVIDGSAQATVVIDDNDTTLPKVSLQITEAKTVENDSAPAIITFSRTGSAASALAVPYTLSGTASSNDYAPLSGTLTIPAGAASAALEILTANDSRSEPLETLLVSIASTAAFIADPLANSATALLVDDDVQIVTVEATDSTASERDLSLTGAVADTATYLVTREGDLSEPLTVYYAISGTNSGSAAGALHGVDFEALPGVLTIPAGQSSAAVTIIPRWDGLGEGPENVVLQLGAGPTNYRLGTPTSALVTITDAGDPPYVEVLSTDNATEGGTSGNFRFSIKGSISGNIVVNYTLSGTATSGADFTALPGQVTISGNGANIANVSVAPVNDTLAEDLETLTLTITPGAAYQTFEPTRSATIWFFDNEQPTLFVDAHSTSYPPAFTENGSGGSFFITRTGSTNSALTVNYSMSGTAVNGSDYQTLSGTATILAGRTGVDINVVPINDTAAEGTETVTLSLAPGAYGRGPAATFYLTDNETPATPVSFVESSQATPEGAGTVNIPVVLSAPAASTVTVEYLVDSSARSSVSANGTAASPLPYWVRCDRIGGNMVGYTSLDGTNWTAVSTQSVALGSSYLAGLYVCSQSSSALSTAVFDNVTVTNLQPGATVGSRSGANIGSTSLAGSTAVVGGTYTVSGAGDNVEGTTDQGYFTWWPVNNSTSCTIVARVVSQQNTHALATAGVMIRESTANNAPRGFMAATPGSGFEYHYRTTLGGQSEKVTSSPERPLWVRLQRSGNLISAFQSSDGSAWTQVSSNLPIAFGTEILAGLTVAAGSDSRIATAVIDNVTLSPATLPTLLGQTVGFSGTQGTDSLEEGTYTLTAAGDGINGTSDDCYFVAAPLSGDFVLTARVVALDGTATSPQAGVMIRENTRRTARMAYFGGRPGTAPQLVWRTTTVTAAEGNGVDFSLAPGLLTFPPGTTTQHVSVVFTDDTLPEPDEPISIVLRNPMLARLGAVSQFTLVIADDDAPPAHPFVGFAAAFSSSAEGSGVIQIPVTLSIPAPANASVDYTILPGTAIPGVDFTAGSGTITFAAGDSVGFATLNLLDDLAIEPSKTVIVRLSSPTAALFNTVSNHTFTILDDDSPVISIVASVTNASEMGDPASMTVVRSGSTNNAFLVNLTRTGTASSSSDYSGIESTLTIPAGETSVPLMLTPLQDTAVEGTETAIIGIASGAGYTIGRPSSVTNFITDDDRNVVTISADDLYAYEGGASGTITLTRTGSTSSSLSVGLTVTGTATSGSDYSTVPSTVSTVIFAIGQSTRTITVNAVNDIATEGDELLLFQISTGSYDIGGTGYASIAIKDNDVPPTVFINSPRAQGVVVALTNGLFFEASATDDGAPLALAYHWTQVTGPGTISFESTNSLATAATFSAPGVYLVRVTVTDGQFTVSDQIAVNIGTTNALTPSDWISADIGPATLRGFSGRSASNWVVSGTGIGYATSSDRAHAISRPITGDGSITARLTALNGPSASEAGLSVRDSMHRYSRRAALVYDRAARTLRLRARQTANTTGFSVAASNLDLPLWVRLERNTNNNTVSAFYAPDVAGAAGSWTQLGTNVVISMDATANYSLTGHSGSDTAAATMVFDNVTLTPEPLGSALLAEDFGDGTQTGTYSYNSGSDVHSVSGKGSLDGSGMFRGEQFTGDFVLTALQLDVTSDGNNSRSGIMIRDSMDDGCMVFFGRNPVGSFSCFVWRTNPKGSTAGLGGVTAVQRWFRLIRRGNQVTALHAPNNSGVPGAWVQLGQPQTVFLQPTVIAGLYCDNAGGVGLNTATFTKLSIVPLNNAPIVDAGTTPTNSGPEFRLAGRVQDDGLPAPFTAAWTVAAGDGVTFSDSNQLVTTATVATAGTVVARLWADDGIARSFDDVTFSSSSGNAFQTWQTANFPGGSEDPNAAPGADPDGDGLNNAGEYAFNTNPNAANAHPMQFSIVTNGVTRFLRVAVPRNPAATDATVTVEAANEAAAASWSTAGLLIETNTPTLLQVRDYVPVPAANKRFMRVRVTLP